jgi:hypothetical protein
MLRLAGAIVICVSLATSQARALDWIPYQNDRFGFSLRYPGDLFAPDRKSEAGDGEVFVSAGGEGRLLVGAFANSERHTVASYMSLIRGQSYGAFQVTYAPRGATWFVLSGESAREVFYEKVMFSCGGRIINSFSLIYPVQDKARFDPVVAGIERTFRPGGDCSYATR